MRAAKPIDMTETRIRRVSFHPPLATPCGPSSPPASALPAPPVVPSADPLILRLSEPRLASPQDLDERVSGRGGVTQTIHPPPASGRYAMFRLRSRPGPLSVRFCAN